MDRNQIKSDLYTIFTEVFSDNSIVITDELNAEKVERWDSLTHLSMISKVEDFYGIKFKLKELISMKNVGDMMDLIIQKKQS